MNLFNPKTRMTELVHSNYLLLPVLNRFGIKLGFNDKSVKDVCANLSIDSHFFLAIINTFHIQNYFPEEELLSFSSKLIVDYLRKSHLDFIKVSLPKIESSLIKLVDNSNSEDLKIIQSFYINYKDELLEHIKDEEDNAFPYVLQLQEAYDLKIDAKTLAPGVLNYSIQSFEKEHSDVDEKLFDLKNIIIKYLSPKYEDTVCNEFLFNLFQFENDLKDHARIEDRILVPKAIKLEQLVKKTTSNSTVKTSQHQHNNPANQLSSREKDVVKCIALGKTNKEIAEELHISPHTVISHRKNITEKLGIKTISGITTFAILNHMIDTSLSDLK